MVHRERILVNLIPLRAAEEEIETELQRQDVNLSVQSRSVRVREIFVEFFFLRRRQDDAPCEGVRSQVRTYRPESWMEAFHSYHGGVRLIYAGERKERHENRPCDEEAGVAQKVGVKARHLRDFHEAPVLRLSVAQGERYRGEGRWRDEGRWRPRRWRWWERNQGRVPWEDGRVRREVRMRSDGRRRRGEGRLVHLCHADARRVERSCVGRVLKSWTAERIP